LLFHANNCRFGSLIFCFNNFHFIWKIRLPFNRKYYPFFLRSRHPFVSAALELLKDLDKPNTTAALWADHKWSLEWQKNTYRIYTFISSLGPHHREWPYT